MTDAATLTEDLQKPWRHGEHLDARGTVLDAPLVLDGMSLRGFDLSGAHLKGGLSARGATFLGLAWLKDTRIDGTCDLTDARFRIDLRAEGMQTGTLLLDHVEVRGVLALARVRAKTISMTEALVLANLTLEGATAAETVDMTGAEIFGGLWANGAHIEQMRDADLDLYGRYEGWSQAEAG